MNHDENEERPSDSLELKFREVKDMTVIDIHGRIDLNASELIELVGWLLKRGKKKFLLNFEDVELLDHSGLTVLAIVYKNTRNHEAILKFSAVPLHIMKLLHIAQLLDVFEVFEEEESALKSFQKKAVQESGLPATPPRRRRFKRLDVASFSVSFVPSYRKDDPTYFEGTATNLGGEGLFLHAQKIYPLKTELFLKLHLPQTNALFDIEGVVLWIADKELQPRLSPGMGIQFKHPNSEQQKRLLDFIDRNATQRSG